MGRKLFAKEVYMLVHGPVGTRFVQMVAKTSEWKIQLGSACTIYTIRSSSPRDSGGKRKILGQCKW